MSTTSQQGAVAAKFMLFGSTTICYLLQFFLIFARGEWLPIDNTSDLMINIACLVVSSYSIIFKYELWVYELGLITLIAASVNFLWMLTKVPVFSQPLLRELSLFCIMLFNVMQNVCIFLPIIPPSYSDIFWNISHGVSASRAFQSVRICNYENGCYDYWGT